MHRIFVCLLATLCLNCATAGIVDLGSDQHKGAPVVTRYDVPQGYWPLTAAIPGVDVPCTGCIYPHTGKLTPGYPPSILTFTGRFLDSQATQDFQQPFRTARAFHVVRAGDKLYTIIGSAEMTYNLSTFFSRVANGPNVSGGQRCCGSYPDRYLSPDASFYAESGGWTIPGNDGQERLFGLDVDDQGYIYLAYSFYGWGIVGNGVSSQYLATLPDDVPSPQKIAALKGSNGHYYALISGQTGGVNIFDVTDRANPVRLASSARSLFNFAKTSAADIIGLATTNGRLQILSTNAIVSGGNPLVDIPASKGVACDGVNFYATSDTTSGLVISVFSPSRTGYARTDYPTTPDFVSTQSLTWGDGYLVWAGTMANGATNLRVFRVNNGITELDLQGYFQRYYIAVAPPYTAPGWGHFWDSTVAHWGDHVYLVVMAYGLGDVYELPLDGYIPPPPPPPPPNCTNVPAGCTCDIATGFVTCPPPPPSPSPPAPDCATIKPGVNVFITFTAPSGCSYLHVQCVKSETISFAVSGFGYDFACAPHSFSWEFGDGSAAFGQNVTHAYAAAGHYVVTARVTVNGVTYPVTQAVEIPAHGRHRAADH